MAIGTNDSLTYKVTVINQPGIGPLHDIPDERRNSLFFGRVGPEPQIVDGKSNNSTRYIDTTALTKVNAGRS